MSLNRKDLVVSFLWQYGERICSQGLMFIVTIVLARLLAPQEYGVVSIAMVSITLLEVFVTSGLGNALVQKKNAESIDFSSVFWFNLCLSILIYILLFFCAPLIANWFNISALAYVIQLMSTKVIFASFNTIQYAYVQRNMMFKKLFYAGLAGNIVSAIIGISMAYSGYGVYALVGQYLSNTIINTITLFCIISWRPRFEFSKECLFSLLSYGWKIFTAGFLNTVTTELKSIVISKQYTPADLAFYDKGKQIPFLVYDNINTSIGKVLFPVIAQCQDDLSKVLMLMRKSMSMMAFILFPLLVGLFSVAENLISFLLTDKWLLSVPFLRVSCVTLFFVLFNTVFTNAINAIGLSKIHLYTETTCAVLGIIALFAMMNLGTIFIALSVTLTSLFSVIMRSFYVRKYLRYDIRSLFQDIYKPMLGAIIMGYTIYFVNILGLPCIWSLLLQFILGVVIYVIFAFIMMKDQIELVRKIFRS